MNNKKDIFIIILLYTLAHGLILLNTGIYWDDWVLYNQERGVIANSFKGHSMVWAGPVYDFLFSLEQGIVICRIIIFLSYLFSALLLNSILKTVKKIDSHARIFIVLLFALFPVNSARISVMLICYAISYFAFFLGLWLVSKLVPAILVRERRKR